MARKAYDTVSEAVNDLIRRGYNADFSINGEKDCLLCKGTSKELSPHEFKIDETYRFEGETDPGDEMIVFAISSLDGMMKGIVVNGYGVYASPEKSRLVKKLSAHL